MCGAQQSCRLGRQSSGPRRGAQVTRPSSCSTSFECSIGVSIGTSSVTIFLALRLPIQVRFSLNESNDGKPLTFSQQGAARQRWQISRRRQLRQGACLLVQLSQ